MVRRTLTLFGVILPAFLLLSHGRALAAAAVRDIAGLRLLRLGPEARADWPLACRAWADDPGMDALAETALRLDPENARAWLLKGRVAWLSGRCAEAAEAWQQVVTLAPHDRTAWLFYFLSGQADLRPEPALAREIAGYFTGWGDRARSTEDWEEALGWYEQAFSLAPDVPTAGRLESVYLKLERKEEAIARWEELARVLPEADPGHWWAVGRAAELRQEWAEAAEAYGRGAGRSDNPYDYRMRQGAAYERLKDWARAEAAYRRAGEARPDLPWPYLSVGHMRRAQEDYEGMLAWYRKAEEVAPNRYEPPYWLGYAHYLREEYPAAQAHLERALGINPQHPWSAYYLAWSLYRQGERDEAIGWMRQAIGVYTGKPWQWAVQLGDWLAEAGDWEGALQAYRQALEWKPGDEEIEGRIRAVEGSTQ